MIGYIAYPKLGHPSPYSAPMPLSGKQIPNRYQIAQTDEADGAAGETINRVNKDPGKGLKPSNQKFTAWVDAKNPSMMANTAHESQHSIYSKIGAQHGLDFQHRLIEKTMSTLEPWERNTLKHFNIHKYPAEAQAEENLAYLHNYLTDKRYRDRVHAKHKLSPKASQNLQGAGKHIFKKLRDQAATLDYQTVQKSEPLAKRDVPVFPKLGVPDRRKEIELINQPHTLLTKLRAMGHTGSRNVTETASADEKQYHAGRAKHEAKQEHANAMLGTTNQMGAVANRSPIGYALSGVLRPSAWANKHENDSHGTLKHEEFHAQMNRIEQKFGRQARRNLVSNLWEALPLNHQNLLSHLQNHWAGDLYEQRNPTMAVEEKIARLFNHLNSPDTRSKFHWAEDIKTHELPNGDVAPEGMRVIPGENRLYSKSDFDAGLKDAHKMLLAAGETANENWLRPGHTSNEEIATQSARNEKQKKRDAPLKEARDRQESANWAHDPEGKARENEAREAWNKANPHQLPLSMIKNEASAHSDTIDHMMGYTHSLAMLCGAARFLSGKPTDDMLFRNALRQNDGDVAVAALIAHGLEPSKENLKALYSVKSIQELHKSATTTKYEVTPGHPEAESVATLIQEAIENGNVQSIKLGGKHSSGSLLVHTKEENWLIKPGDSKNSPASGVAEETATQAEREVAFYKCAEAVGLGHIVPRAELIWLNKKQAAAIHMLPFSWKNLDSLKVDEPNIGRMALEPYRASGELFKWAVLDYVLGNPDSHGMNIMVSDKEDGRKVALIDHGSAFAGLSFNPGEDSDSWIPYYLRVWSTRKWKDMTYEERLKCLPRAPAEKEQELFHWVLSINPERIGAIMQRYGINANPSLARLAEVKSCKSSMDLFIGKLWIL